MTFNEIEQQQQQWKWRGLFSSHQNPCFSNPCLHDSICLNGYTDKQYLCQCQAGYTGEQCEKGVAKKAYNTRNISALLN